MKTPTSNRDYPTLVERVRSLQSRGWDVREAGKVCDLPILTAGRASGGRNSEVLLVGGIHGDEPAGVEAAVSWMESGMADRWAVDWLVLPCANPCGWTCRETVSANEFRILNRETVSRTQSQIPQGLPRSFPQPLPASSTPAKYPSPRMA